MSRIVQIIVSFLSSFFFANAFADQISLPRFNMTRGVTPLSKDIYDLHMTVFLICLVIGIIVFGMLFWSLIHHRKARGIEPAQFEGNHQLEVLWAIIPFVILIAMAIPATIVLFRIYDTSLSDITIKITGYQWKWQYEYLDQGIKFFSNLSTPLAEINNKAPKNTWYLLQVDNPLVLPTNRKIRFLITSNDVIHSWWMPAFGIKKDAVPGYIHEAWAVIEKPGTYRGQCAELCGVNHAFMPIVVIAKKPEEFQQWVTQQKQQQAKMAGLALENLSFDQAMNVGKATYNKYCAACHQENGRGLPPTYPALKGSSVAVGKPVSRHISTVLNGVPGTAMQAFKDQLTDVELAAVITYERNAWENNTGDLIQPKDVQALRNPSATPAPPPQQQPQNQTPLQNQKQMPGPTNQNQPTTSTPGPAPAPSP